MPCISTTSFQVMINGSLGFSFKASRGLRQGEPLFPYLFLICMEALTMAISKAEVSSFLKGIKIKKRSPSISHLLFADDCFIFSHASVVYASSIKNILEDFQAASGQCANLSKLAIVFCQNASRACQ